MSTVKRSGRRGSATAIAAILLFIAVATVAVVVVGVAGQRPGAVSLTEPTRPQVQASSAESLSAPPTASPAGPTATRVTAAPAAPDRPAIGSQATFYDLTRDKITGTASQHEPWPALSLVKLYLADHVISHGTVEGGFLALEMVATSDDGIADRLYRKYPDSIGKVADYYGLDDTTEGGYWGQSVTSMYDAVSFLAQLHEDDPHHPIFTAMSLSTPEAADGYDQDFGTSVLPGAYGTKWGWSNDRSLHASVTVGEGWIAAAAVDGGADTLTDYAQAQLSGLARDATMRARAAADGDS